LIATIDNPLSDILSDLVGQNFLQWKTWKYLTLIDFRALAILQDIALSPALFKLP
jgi:hypothetical protein